MEPSIKRSFLFATYALVTAWPVWVIYCLANLIQAGLMIFLEAAPPPMRWPLRLIPMAITCFVWGGSVGYLGAMGGLEKLNLRQFISSGQKSFLALAGLSLLLMVCLIPLFIGILFLLMGAQKMGIHKAVVITPLAAGLIYCVSRVIFWPYGMVLENPPFWKGFHLSLETSRNRWWMSAAAIMVVTALGGGLLNMVLKGATLEMWEVGNRAAFLARLIPGTLLGGTINFLGLSALTRLFLDIRNGLASKDH